SRRGASADGEGNEAALQRKRKRARTRHPESSKSKGRSSPKVLGGYLSRNGAESEVVRLTEALGAGAADRYIGCASWHAHGAVRKEVECTRISHVTLPAALCFNALSSWPLRLRCSVASSWVVPMPLSAMPGLPPPRRGLWRRVLTRRRASRMLT